ncbi:aminotransferase class I/II-fold pyridoxal phosphate-dependent enzyme [Bosea sp. (in: a-proteobacteria)]|uniref:aminotransferase class I/II-fold pyridoxal phosphate-dependent enzyme n=1 Tax=Bosea sp. (in: a-proteobacteria) TaxID=1871050 RepID=UPI002609B8CC|nr:aminotransferase class I/II-fold pyridoxal phosphate-dependent enzyme [Bosea sp. (in: a-proteobacteria)]MCO5093560.1 aminotransferase class I/II-fold pyridoxal phosphate-dependent enzyme [Bosea sp. (in: a-proteobacteria)]
MKTYENLPNAALTGSMRDFRVPGGADLERRVGNFFKWQNLRRQNGLWPFSRATDFGPRTEVLATDDRGIGMEGVNFASQDYLSMSSHPAIKETALAAIERYGVHSAGSAALVGNTTHSVALERKIADFLKMEDCLLYPTGWGAGYGVIRGLVRSSDHIVMDALAHTCLQEGANAATRNIYLFRHLDVAHCRRWLEKIRSTDTENGIMVVTEGLFSMDSDTPDIAAMQELCNEFNATLMVDVAHDLGALGPGGRGHIGAQDMLGKVDIVMGSFSKTFASNGGFVAVKERPVKEYLRFYSPTTTFSNAMSPVNAAIVLKAFEIIETEEGQGLRDELMANVLELRRQVREAGLDYYGDPSAIVAVKMGSEGLARLVSRELPELGLLANLVEYPAVGKGSARFRMQVMAKHSRQNITNAVERIVAAKATAEIALAAAEAGRPTLRAVA